MPESAVEHPPFSVEIHEEGSGVLCPNLSIVEANYHGTFFIGGETFSKGSVTNTIGKAGGLIRGWNEAFLKFRVGTKATIICPPDYAYGDDGCEA